MLHKSMLFDSVALMNVLYVLRGIITVDSRPRLTVAVGGHADGPQVQYPMRST